MTQVCKVAGTQNVRINIRELDAVPEEGTLYRVDLLQGFTLLQVADYLGHGVEICVSPLKHEGQNIILPTVDFQGNIIRLTWVTAAGDSLFRWYLLDDTAAGSYFVHEVRAFVARRRSRVQDQTVFVTERK